MLETQWQRHTVPCPKGVSILSEETDNEQTSETGNVTSMRSAIKYLAMIKSNRITILTKVVENGVLNEMRKEALQASGGRERRAEWGQGVSHAYNWEKQVAGRQKWGPEIESWWPEGRPVKLKKSEWGGAEEKREKMSKEPEAMARPWPTLQARIRT